MEELRERGTDKMRWRISNFKITQQTGEMIVDILEKFAELPHQRSGQKRVKMIS